MQAILKRMEVWDSRTVLYVLMGMAVGSLIVSFTAHLLSGNINLLTWLDGATQNFSTEMMGAIVTFGLVELIFNTQLNKQVDIAERYNRQISTISRLRQAETPTQKQAILDEMRKLNLFDGADLQGISLEGLYLIGYDLQNVNLNGANLAECKLMGANLSDAKLSATNLSNADLSHANLENANLSVAVLEKTNFRKAKLNCADLYDARLTATNLRDASLEYANLECAELSVTEVGGAVFTNANLKNASINHLWWLEDDKALAPDNSEWVVNTDMSRYTDPNHPNFYEPEWVKEQREQGEGE